MKNEFKFGKEVVILTVDDIKRMRELFGLTQQNLADDLGKSKSYIGQIESQSKNLSDNFKETLNEYFTGLSNVKFKSIQQMKKDNDEKRDKYIDNLAKFEQRKATALDVIAQRKSASFSPSITPSVDMIWLQNVIDGHKKKVLFDNFIYSTDPQIEVTHNYPKQIEKDSQYLISIQCADVHITVRFGFKTKDSCGDITNKMVLQFNPNKADFESNHYLQLLFYILGVDPKCRKFDVCKDYVGVPMTTVSISNTQRKGVYQYISKCDGVTHYLGDINSNGIRVYDKRAEIKAKDSVTVNGELIVNDIGYECVRYEHRRTMHRATVLSKIIDELEGINLPILSSYDCVNLLCSNEEEMQKSKIDLMTYSTATMVLEGRLSATELKASNRTQYAKVMRYLEGVKLDNLCLSDVEIVQSVVLFNEKYLMAYEKGYNAFNEELSSKQFNYVSDESINKATDMLINIIDGSTEKVDIKPLTKEEQKEQLRKMAQKKKDKNIAYVQTTFGSDTFVNPPNDTKYF